MSKRAKITHHDPETHSRHLKRQLESLEKDNHQSLNDIEGLISIALSAQEDEGMKGRSFGYRVMIIYNL
jgi:zinc finger HIT domain-containing protein 1